MAYLVFDFDCVAPGSVPKRKLVEAHLLGQMRTPIYSYNVTAMMHVWFAIRHKWECSMRARPGRAALIAVHTLYPEGNKGLALTHGCNLRQASTVAAHRTSVERRR
jgi:hypothetical protein